MEIPQEVLIVGGVAVLGVVVLCVIFVLQRRRADFTGSESAGQKPEWMHEMPPPETVAATQADGEGITLYDYDEGEVMASAFAEQIEDIVRARVSEDPALAGLDLDFGTGPDGGLEFLVDGQTYTDIGQIPNEHLRDVIRQAIESWNQR